MLLHLSRYGALRRHFPLCTPARTFSSHTSVPESVAKPAPPQPSLRDFVANAKPKTKPNLLGLSKTEVAKLLEESGLPLKPYAINQIWSAIYERGASTFDVMTDISKTTRQQLSDHFSLDIGTVKVG